MKPLDIAIKVASRWLQAAATPLPDSFPESEIGLMTLWEYLEFQDERNVSHPSTAYNWDLEDMNKEDLTFKQTMEQDRKKFSLYAVDNGKGYLIKEERSRSAKTLAVIHNGTLYYEDNPPPPVPYDLDIRKKKQVKYLSEYIILVSDVAKDNFKDYPVLIQNIKAKGESLQVRASKPPVKNAGTSLAILNSDNMKVAVAQDEWGATLVSVSKEYRGYGLGKKILKYWTKFNPDYRSGGFTGGGKATAISVWEDRVREFLSYGWYSELVKQGRINKDQVGKILSGLSNKTQRTTLPVPDSDPDSDPETETLIYADGTTFLVYDKAFLVDQDEKYVYGHGFFRDASVGMLLYSIDYERPYHELTTYVALQMARDKGEELYNGDGYSDLLELDGLDHIEREGDYISLTKDVLPLETLSRKEKSIRSEVDPYDEKRILLLEAAEYKWF